MSLINVNTPPDEDYYFSVLHTYTSTTSLSLQYTWEAPFTGYLNMNIFPWFTSSAGVASCASWLSNDTSRWHTYAAGNVNTTGTAACAISGLRVTAGQKIYIFTSHRTAATNRVYIRGVLHREVGNYIT